MLLKEVIKKYNLHWHPIFEMMEQATVLEIWEDPSIIDAAYL
jgi:hypothetical protein